MHDIGPFSSHNALPLGVGVVMMIVMMMMMIMMMSAFVGGRRQHPRLPSNTYRITDKCFVFLFFFFSSPHHSLFLEE